MIAVEVRVFLDRKDYVAGITNTEPIPTDHTLQDVMAGLRSAFAAFESYTGRDFEDVDGITIIINVRTRGIDPADDFESGKLVDHSPGDQAIMAKTRAFLWP